ncbi:MAG: hypothetical protein U1B30_17110 [Pseudomonadota bacterium]|nr:hypothetical protein [Pseudomonadota bacterium]
MSASFRRVVQLLLVTLVINAGGWTFNREAVTDAFLGGVEYAALADDEAATTQSGEEETGLKGVVCNHWCHAVGHFVGIFYLHMIFLTEVGNNCFFCKQSVVAPALPEGLYRPPRIFF